MDEQAWTRVNELWLELNRPSPERLNAVLMRQGINVNLSNLRKFLSRRSEKQVFAPRPVYKGRVYAVDKDQRWAADIVDYTKNPAELDGRRYTYALIVQDIFTRYAWAQLMESRDQAAGAFERILEQARNENHRPPHVLTTDEDSVFMGNRFQDLLRRNHIAHGLKKSREDIATIDRLIGTVRRALAVNVKGGATNWAETLRQTLAGYNRSPHRKIFGETPADVSKPPETEHQRSVIFDMRYQGAQDMELNQDRIDKRKEKLQAARGFRVLLKTKRLNQRVYRQVWSDGVHLIKGFDETGAQVQDTHDRWFPTKDALPVDVPEHEIPEAAQEVGEAKAVDEEIEDDERLAGPSVERGPSPSADRAEKERLREKREDWGRAWGGRPSPAKAFAFKAKNSPARINLDDTPPPRPKSDVHDLDVRPLPPGASSDVRLARFLQAVRQPPPASQSVAKPSPPQPPQPVAKPAPSPVPKAADMPPPPRRQSQYDFFINRLKTQPIRDDEELAIAQSGARAHLDQLRARLKRSERPEDSERLEEVNIATNLLKQRIAQYISPVALPKLPPPAPQVKRGGGGYRAVAGELLAAELQTRGIRSAEEEEAARKRQHAAYVHMKKLEGRPKTPELEREIAMLRAQQELLKGRRKAFKAKAKPTSG
jgi:hypothetical protein